MLDTTFFYKWKFVNHQHYFVSRHIVVCLTTDQLHVDIFHIVVYSLWFLLLSLIIKRKKWLLSSVYLVLKIFRKEHAKRRKCFTCFVFFILSLIIEIKKWRVSPVFVLLQVSRKEHAKRGKCFICCIILHCWVTDQE